ncbi:MAG TPA: PhzF family phenazine biosynthesis protein [Acidimicrobiia bacterium]|nr:PhzF family phenazine biosynthesis protein [Acidimicrobiia bacterium]
MGDVEIFGVDAFTNEAFRGNPAAVCLLDAPADAAWMQAVAAEMNLSETAFVVTTPLPGGELPLRWFTPAVEVALCGHATLASAHVLFGTGRLPRSAGARFATASGVLGAAAGADGSVELDFPALPSEPAPEPSGLTGALGARVVVTLRNTHDLLVELEDAAAVRALTPDVAALAAFDTRAVVVTARAETGRAADFVSRCFAPRVGVPEDPVTGSAHCALAPYWANRLGKTTLVGHQVSSRGGTITCTVTPDARVRLAGQAVTVWRGTLTA